MKIYQVLVPKDPVQEGNYEDDVVTDAQGNKTVTKKARDKIPIVRRNVLIKRLQIMWTEK